MPSAKSSIVVLACLLLALLSPTGALALDFTLKGKIQSELDANPFLKEQQIKLQVLREESGYVTIEMTEGNSAVRQAIKEGIDVLGGQLENQWLIKGSSERERKTANALKKSIEYIKKMEGVKEVQLTAAVNTRQDQAEKLLDQAKEAKKKQEYSRAAQLYEKAVELGSMKAAVILGRMYLQGQGLSKDEAKGATLMHRAAERGDLYAQRDAQFELANLYNEGRGVQKNNNEAIAWLKKAAELGYPDAQLALGGLYENGEWGLPKDKILSDVWYSKAVSSLFEYAKHGEQRSQFMLGMMYLSGKGVMLDYGEAITWLEECQNSDPRWALDVGVQLGLAKIYATCKEPQYRDGRKAVQHALAFEKIRPNSFDAQDTLAAAYARDNQFTKAVAAQQKAISLLQEVKMDEEKKSKTLKQSNERLALYKSDQPFTDLGQQTENETKPPAPKEPANQEIKPPTSKAPEPARQEQGGQAGEQPQPGSGPAQTTVERIKAFARNITHPSEETPKPQAAAPPAPKTQEPAQQEQGSQTAENQQQEDRELTARMQALDKKAEEKRQQERHELEKKIEEQKQAAERRETLRKEDERVKAAQEKQLPLGGLEQYPFPLPFEDQGACPFEGCIYREWIALKETNVFKSRSGNADKAFVVQKGQKVWAHSGVVIVSKPGIEQAKKAVSIGKHVFQPGDKIYVLTPIGEGYCRVWIKGVMDTISLRPPDFPEDAFVPLVMRQYDWWVQISDELGQTGWTNEAGNFGNNALFSGDPAPEPTIAESSVSGGKTASKTAASNPSEERELAQKIEGQKQAAERREAIRREDERKKATELARLEQVRAEAAARAAAAEASRLAGEARVAQEALARTRADATAKAAALQSAATSTTRGREGAKPIAESTYEGTVVQRVRTYWKKPKDASWDASLQAQVFITVNRNGEVVDIRFSQKSRDNRFDELAEKTIRTAAPMPPFPAVMQKETTVIGLRFKAGEFGIQ